MPGQRSWRLFAPVFALVYAVLYATRRPVFVFYPLEGAVTLERLPHAEGPGMLWYGWLTAALLAALATSAAVPARWAARMPPGISWMAVLGAMTWVVVDELLQLFASGTGA